MQVSPTFLGWCCSFGDKLKIVGRDATVKKLKEYIGIIIQAYQND